MSDPIAEALAELGIRRLLLAIHDVSFPSDPDEDLGRGTPASAAGARFLAFARGLGFTGIQLGPQGQTSRSNPSPYDGMMFSRDLCGIAVRSLRSDGSFAGLVDDAAIARVLVTGTQAIARHVHAYDAVHGLVSLAHAALRAGQRPDLAAKLAAFRTNNAAWLYRDSLFAAISESRGGISYREWPDPLSRMWRPRPGEDDAYRQLVTDTVRDHAEAIDRYAFGQMLAHEEHARVRAIASGHGLALYGDLQVGYGEADKWANGAVFLEGYAMGAPPSRTNPAGQPWNYPVLDPARLGDVARALVAARLDKAFAEYDSIRIDHPHGLVCPWVYRSDTGNDARAVRDGARLFESPDLADHPRLASFSIPRPDQIDRTVPRHADRWIRDLEDAQVERYARLFDLIEVAAARHCRSISAVSCEVLSTLPLPLERVLRRLGLGRWRVTQKANLDDPSDVYRTENAVRADWVMLGNHDTPPVFALIRSWSAATREAWIGHLSRRLRLPSSAREALGRSDGQLATAMLAELFACAAENVSIFFADLFGLTERFNAPGTISDDNWSMRLTPDFEIGYARRLARDSALDLRRALALALDARGSTSGLAARLR